tara:strand:+ start:71 stop:940 length:870 start_codon:yes stop_codon:yes gene_type:complete
MARNNEDRFGSPKMDAPPPPSITNPEAVSDDRLFSFVSPTELVDLPSRGKYYSTNHPLHNKESLEIRYMTAKDEDILTSQSLLKKGLAIDRLLQNVIVDKDVKVDDLLIGDKNALLIATRISGYGELYEAKVGCPSCYELSDHEFSLDELNVNYGVDSDEKGVKYSSENNTFLVTLPKMQVEVGLRLLNGNDEKSMAKMTQKKKKNNLPDTPLTDQFYKMIVSVNGSTDRFHINELVDVMPASDSRYLRKIYTEIVPNVELKQDFECHACGAVEEVVIPLTTEFFWPKS